MPERDAECQFCNIRAPIYENELASVIFDRYPVNPGNALILSKRHIESFFETTPYGCIAILSLVAETRRKIDRQLVPDVHNIRINVGAAAAQTVLHVHMHLLSRLHDDVENPRGVIPATESH
jgi:diadenosine tetraphosphate (Ap4A) HIT family hydrolase